MAYCRAIHKTVLKHFQLHGLIAFRFAFLFSQGLMRVKWDFVLILALASNNLSVFSPQGPTEGCGVIPVKGHRMCTDPDPGGYHAAGLTVIHTPVRNFLD